MYLTIKLQLQATHDEKQILRAYSRRFQDEVERIIRRYQKLGSVIFIPYKWVSSDIAFYSKNQVLHYAKTLYEERRLQHRAVYPSSFSCMAKSMQLEKNSIVFTFGQSFLVPELRIRTEIHKQQWKRLCSGELVKADIREIHHDFYAYLLLCVHTPNTAGILNEERKMGVDIGMRCQAVCYTCDGVIRFVGNGREIRYHTRRFRKRADEFIKRTQGKKKQQYHRLNDYKRYIDHCLAREIVNFAIEQKIQIICLEKLYHLQKKFSKHEQICWSYQRLQQFIAYKAKLAGIHIRYVNPRLTSKRCPSCGKINNVKGRTYTCRCGFHHHRDVVGAMNILHAPEIL